MNKKKILFLSASMGGGHNAAVDAVCQAIEKYYPGQYELKKIDIVALVLPYIERAASQLYDVASKYSKLTYKAFFEISDFTSAQKILDVGGYQFLKRQLKPVAAEKPDVIVVCFPLFAWSVGKYLRTAHKRVPMVTLITDTGDVHSAWLSRGVDYYIAPTKDTALFLEEEGIKENQIKLLGFAVKQWFYKHHDTAKTRAELNINPKRRVVIYFAGVLGLGNVKSKVTALDKALDNLTIIVICGKNEGLRHKLESQKFHNDVRIMGFVENSDVAKYMSMADVVITKAGGMSVMEAVTSKRPIIITEVIPGQEEPNAEFIETMGFGYVAKTSKKLIERTALLLDGDDAERVAENLRRYHLNDHADKSVADFIHGLVE